MNNKKIIGTVKKLIKPSETEQLKNKFLELFLEEMCKRKMLYYQAKEKKDEVFRELEHLKTSSRLMESRMKKKLSSKPDSVYPLKLDISLVKSDLSNNVNNIIGNDKKSNLEVYYKMDNGKDIFTSDSSDNIEKPTWDNVFTVTLHDSHERLYFQIFAKEMNATVEKLIDTFDITASIISQNLHSNINITDNISTSLLNHFTLCIRNKTEVNPKLYNYRSKIEKFESMMLEVEPPYNEARSKFEKFLNLKGIDLLNEWGILGENIKLIKKTKT